MKKNNPIPIVINRMFTGDKYLNDNIGHEIINLFAADDDNNYIYFCDKGTYNKSAYELPKYSIQVRPAGAKLLEVINIAEIDRNAQININEITYGKVELLKIFKDNKKQGTNTFVTFKASKVIKPLSPKYIAYSDHKSQIPDCVECKFKVNEKLRNYIKPSDSDYEKLYQFARFAFSDNLNWTEVNDTVVLKEENEENDTVVLKEENKSYKHRVTPGEIYGIINLELPYSNAFRFFIEQYPKLLSGFCKHIQSEVKCKKLDNICDYFDKHADHKLEKIEREWKNIDLLIEVDDKWVIVIENKIFSELNGKKAKEGITQLNTYQQTIEKKYNKGWNKIFVLLLPDHNDIDISKYKDWQKIYYSSISAYLKEFIRVLEYRDRHLEDFAFMVKQHSDKDYNYGVMKRRFERALRKT